MLDVCSEPFQLFKIKLRFFAQCNSDGRVRFRFWKTNWLEVKFRVLFHVKNSESTNLKSSKQCFSKIIYSSLVKSYTVGSNQPYQITNWLSNVKINNWFSCLFGKMNLSYYNDSNNGNNSNDNYNHIDSDTITYNNNDDKWGFVVVI